MRHILDHNDKIDWNNIRGVLFRVHYALGGEMVRSVNDVPYVRFTTPKGVLASVVYFKKWKNIRLFYPFNDFMNQRKYDFKHPEELAEFVENFE